VEVHTEEVIQRWFDTKLRPRIKERDICHSWQIWNMDESGSRVGCPKGEEVIVPINIKELYTSSPENRKSITIIEAICADGSPLPPPAIICLGMRHMMHWFSENMTGQELILTSSTGYTNEEIALEWLAHFIKYTDSGPDKPWKILLLDSHSTHEAPYFVLNALYNHIELIEFPSHMTHVLQPLDVGLFRPWKHWHNQAVINAIRSFDLEYSIYSFFCDLKEIREKTFKHDTIIHAFRDSGMWPISWKAAQKKMREYKRKKSDIPDPDTEVELPPIPQTYWQCEQYLQE
jgi:hypothetical protein